MINPEPGLESHWRFDELNAGELNILSFLQEEKAILSWQGITYTVQRSFQDTSFKSVYNNAFDICVITTTFWNLEPLAAIINVTTRVEFHIQELLLSDKRPNYLWDIKPIMRPNL